jgi:hypothetical protein
VLASGLSSSATISGSQVTGTVASATTAANLTGNISDMQVINLAADLASASASAVSTANAFAKSTFLPLTGGTLTGALNGTSANLTSANLTGALTGASAKFNGSVAIGGGTPIIEYISVTQRVGPLGALSSGTCTTVQTPALTVFTTGASDTIALGVPSSLTTNLGSGVFLIYQAWETSPGPSPTITIQICNPSGARYKGGASGVIRIDLFKH